MLYKLLNNLKLKKYLRQGLKIGNNFSMQSRVHIDPGFTYLVEIGDNVTLAPEVLILSHDASARKMGGYTSIGKVIIGNNVFIGAKSIILQNVTIGDNVIIGAGSVVTRNVPSNSIACGNPAKVIKSIDEFILNNKDNYMNSIKFNKKTIKKARKNNSVCINISEKLEKCKKGFIDE